MSKPTKSIRRIFDNSVKSHFHSSLERSPQTPKRKPIFSEEKYTTPKKKRPEQQLPTKETGEYKNQAVDFLQKMLARVESKNKFLKQLELENIGLKQQNKEIEKQNEEVIKKIAMFSSLDKLKQKNIQYRAKLIKAEGLLYQLRRSLKQPVKGIDELISSLHF